MFFWGESSSSQPAVSFRYPSPIPQRFPLTVAFVSAMSGHIHGETASACAFTLECALSPCSSTHHCNCSSPALGRGDLQGPSQAVAGVRAVHLTSLCMLSAEALKCGMEKEAHVQAEYYMTQVSR